MPSLQFYIPVFCYNCSNKQLLIYKKLDTDALGTFTNEIKTTIAGRSVKF